MVVLTNIFQPKQTSLIHTKDEVHKIPIRIIWNKSITTFRIPRTSDGPYAWQQNRDRSHFRWCAYLNTQMLTNFYSLDPCRQIQHHSKMLTPSLRIKDVQFPSRGPFAPAQSLQSTPAHQIPIFLVTSLHELKIYSAFHSALASHRYPTAVIAFWAALIDIYLGAILWFAPTLPLWWICFLCLRFCWCLWIISHLHKFKQESAFQLWLKTIALNPNWVIFSSTG